MQKYCNTVLAVLVFCCTTLQSQGSSKVAANELVIVVVTQDSPHHVALANNLRNDLLQQSAKKGLSMPVVHTTLEDFPHHGAWTFLPVVDRLRQLHGSNSSWIFFCEDHTKINLRELINLLDQHDSTQSTWIGHGLLDTEPTIIHHFNNAPKFKYPLLRVGFAASTVLINSLATRLAVQGPPEADFAIDSAYELAQYVFDSGRGSSLTHSPHLCLTEQAHCATFFQPAVSCGTAVQNELIHFAVKTCSRFHEHRVPIVKDTWAREAKNLVFYSDQEDPRIPTTYLGVANTERGHCGKTLAIIRHAASLPNIHWLAIVDDDTLISVSRLRDLLPCYGVTTPLAVGERYGYNVGHRLGYNYITGGGGIVVNMAAVRLLADNCHCPSDTTPDDMYLGVCMRQLEIAIVHSPQFHQARPPDYADELLAVQPAISFHKHWMVNPVTVYHQRLAEQEDIHEEF